MRLLRFMNVLNLEGKSCLDKEILLFVKEFFVFFLFLFDRFLLKFVILLFLLLVLVEFMFDDFVYLLLVLRLSF